MLNAKSIEKLIELNRHDRNTLDFIKSCLDSFEQYHRSVFEDQTFQILYGGGTLDGSDYRDRRSSLDSTRTTCHNSMIMNIRILNRMAAASSIDPVYDGTVSEEKPYRREIANAVFEYVESIINNRT